LKIFNAVANFKPLLEHVLQITRYKVVFRDPGWYAKVFTYLILSDIGSILCASEHEFSASAVKKHQP